MTAPNISGLAENNSGSNTTPEVVVGYDDNGYPFVRVWLDPSCDPVSTTVFAGPNLQVQTIEALCYAQKRAKALNLAEFTFLTSKMLDWP